ncbi:MAG: tRNA uridine-5-carboxymethylaminomethyl(34) synthesis enzyme MnmG, partial [Planctomycetes bacterium]|nr:tRNA uridine-5-carboxymethylaminomethyl(34) synthesis enzyme MnmG [Planctomycetota bacterium]
MADEYDVVVIGAGHAGVEAAWAASRIGARTALVTLSAETIAAMSCNPAVGGVGKGQMVREIDALGGLMGLVADATGIQFRMLNRSKGPAVWGPRCQSDRHEYVAEMRRRLAGLDGLDIIVGEAMGIRVDAGWVIGVDVLLEGGRSFIACRAAIVAAGTFMRGRMHLGEKTWSGGRYSDPSSEELAANLAGLGLKMSRLKTGTCARVASETVDYAECTRQDGDETPTPFSFMNDSLEVEQLPCYLTATTPEIHAKIRENFHRAPLYTGQIKSIGPRYCPSIETKIDRFADKSSHLVFLEPEGRPASTNWVYCNGISTSLPV